MVYIQYSSNLGNNTIAPSSETVPSTRDTSGYQFQSNDISVFQLGLSVLD